MRNERDRKALPGRHIGRNCYIRSGMGPRPARRKIQPSIPLPEAVTAPPPVPTVTAMSLAMHGGGPIAAPSIPLHAAGAECLRRRLSTRVFDMPGTKNKRRRDGISPPQALGGYCFSCRVDYWWITTLTGGLVWPFMVTVSGIVTGAVVAKPEGTGTFTWYKPATELPTNPA